MWRKIIVLLVSLTFCLTTVACSSSPSGETKTTFSNNTSTTNPRTAEGRYPVQQASYDDGDGSYTLMLLNTPPGTPSIYRTTNLQMARLTEEEIAQGEKTYLEIKNNQGVMYLTEDFKIEYVHNVTETRTNPQTGQPETVIVRQQSSFWTPFAGALAGQALGSLLFTPQYYVPPVYQPGGVITGYGGYGRSYSQAVDRYQSKYNSPPAAVSNRQNLRTTGTLRNTTTSSGSTSSKNSSSVNSSSGNNSSTTSTTSTPTRQKNSNTTKSTGSGYGSNTLPSSGNSTGKKRVDSKSRFGSSTSSPRPSRRRSSGFGSRRRR